MGKVVFILILSILISSCNSKTEKFKGDLSFKMITIFSNDGMSKEDEKKLFNKLDSLSENNVVGVFDIKLVEELKKLKELDLLTKPSVILKNKEDYRRIFLSTEEFKKVSNYKLSTLQENNKKVEIELNIRELDSGIYFSDEIIEIKEVDGITPWKK